MRKFKDLLMPFFSYVYMDLSLRVNHSWCRFDGETDTIRLAMAESFPYGIGKAIDYGRHGYTWNIGANTEMELTNRFYSSRFYKDHSKRVGSPVFNGSNLYGWEAKIYSVMTIYEYLVGEK